MVSGRQTFCNSFIIIIIIIISAVNRNQIYLTDPMFIFVKLAFRGHCIHFQVYTINSMIQKQLQDILIFH